MTNCMSLFWTDVDIVVQFWKKILHKLNVWIEVIDNLTDGHIQCVCMSYVMLPFFRCNQWVASWETGQLPTLNFALLEIFLEKASVGTLGIFTLKFRNQAGLSKAKWYLSAFWSAISLCRQMYWVNFRLFFVTHAIWEFQVKVLSTL